MSFRMYRFALIAACLFTTSVNAETIDMNVEAVASQDAEMLPNESDAAFAYTCMCRYTGGNGHQYRHAAYGANAQYLSCALAQKACLLENHVCYFGVSLCGSN